MGISSGLIMASTPYRRQDVLRTVRGANLTGTRERPVRQFDSFEARPGTQLGQGPVAGTGPGASRLGRLAVLRGPALERTIEIHEAETSLFEAGRHIDAGRYTEPND
jgi:hypothetical protein